MTEGEKISEDALKKRLEFFIDELNPVQKDLYYKILIKRQANAGKQGIPGPSIEEQINLSESIKDGSVNETDVKDATLSAPASAKEVKRLTKSDQNKQNYFDRGNYNADLSVKDD